MWGGVGAADRQPPPLCCMPAVYATQNCKGFITECVCVCVCTRARTYVRCMLEYRSLATGNNIKGVSRYCSFDPYRKMFNVVSAVPQGHE